MKKYILLFLMVFIFQKGIGQILTTTVVAKNKNYISVITSMDQDPVQQKQNEKLIQCCIKYIKEYYPKISYPIIIIFDSGRFSDFRTKILYDNYNGDALFESDERLDQLKKTGVISDQIGIKIYIKNKDIDTLLTLLDYGITHEKKFRKQFWKIRKQQRITVEDENSLIVEENEDVNRILSKSKRKIKEFLNNER
ncbi:hypothetical protein M2451_002923 [Dysgonomonas sp. PFB1-18]|uniref:hypothetical protein n=1 Tax=unclassified Dysgonomonas TaxID=2630389 RepID=UPI0013D758DD|nr:MULTISPECIES: hypothetical protein [unclassified Dysgonomonas]MDH6310033.1 hypothetical protein [Dysgonomonas sp. PF1-14]MDH6339942.1 hypothetical protein [Dysgonomonas sp. PF1-16]MDH6381590.1 hypothetical protein [Dysgonomonas sp. PFB1-18]MDH6398773.1 hypothetical protein [Dysgonomonas sp. PF1-23]NDV93618.1 hypothetical protein [Dysgonomonas sp. 521]